MTTSYRRCHPFPVSFFAAALLTGSLLCSGPAHAQSASPGTAPVALEFRQDADVLRLQLETKAGALGNVTLVRGDKPSLRIELKGVTPQSLSELVKQLQKPGKVRALTVLPGLDGRTVLEAELAGPMRVLDETVVALGGNRSRWEVVLADGQDPAVSAAPSGVMPALGQVRFSGSDDRLDMTLEGSAGLVAEVSFEEAPARLVVELPGVPRAQLDQVVATVDNLPPLFRRISAVPPAGKVPGRLVFELRGGVDLVDTGGVAQNGVGQVTMSLVPDSAPVAKGPARQQVLKAIGTELVAGEVSLVLDGAGNARVNAFTLEQPSRVVVDFLGWAPEQVRQAVNKFASQQPVVRQAAITETRMGSARVVFDLVTPVALGSRQYQQLGGDGKMVLALRAPLTDQGDTRLARASSLGITLGRGLDDLRKPEVEIRPVQLDGTHADGKELAVRQGVRYDLVAMLEKALDADAKYGGVKAEFQAVSEAVPQARAGYVRI